jgi:hypothetical protein
MTLSAVHALGNLSFLVGRAVGIFDILHHGSKVRREVVEVAGER